MITNVNSNDTFQATIFVAGNIHLIEFECQKYCDEVGLCVTVEPVKFIYTGGDETGARVGLINYPRFPESNTGDILVKAENLLDILIEKCDQRSGTIVTTTGTHYYERRSDS